MARRLGSLASVAFIGSFKTLMGVHQGAGPMQAGQSF
jgi:hypothetical protein